MEFTWHGITEGNNCPPRKIENFSFIYVLSGKGNFNIHGNTYSMASGDLFVLFPEYIHSYYSCENDPWKLVWFGLSGNSVCATIKKTGILESKPVLMKTPKFLLRDSMVDIVNMLDKPNQDKYFFALSKFFELLGNISLYLNESNSRVRNPIEIIEDALRFLELNYVHSIDITTLASHFGYTRTYFTTLFKKITGKNPIAYLTEIRLSKACSLLKNSNLSIQEISTSVGYQDPFYFSKQFKKYFKQSPKKYR